MIPTCQARPRLSYPTQKKDTHAYSIGDGEPRLHPPSLELEPETLNPHPPLPPRALFGARRGVGSRPGSFATHKR